MRPIKEGRDRSKCTEKEGRNKKNGGGERGAVFISAGKVRTDFKKEYDKWWMGNPKIQR